MDYLKILKASKKINDNNYKIFNEINSLIESGSTGGEIITSVAGYLFNLKKNDFNTYLKIYIEAEEYFKTCREYGYDFIFE